MNCTFFIEISCKLTTDNSSSFQLFDLQKRDIVGMVPFEIAQRPAMAKTADLIKENKSFLDNLYNLFQWSHQPCILIIVTTVFLTMEIYICTSLIRTSYNLSYFKIPRFFSNSRPFPLDCRLFRTSIISTFLCVFPLRVKNSGIQLWWSVCSHWGGEGVRRGRGRDVFMPTRDRTWLTFWVSRASFTTRNHVRN